MSFQPLIRAAFLLPYPSVQPRINHNMKTVGIAMIVKNEEALLSRCLDSVKDADEIVICDTGSTDNTIEVAKQYTNKIFTDYTWNDNFAEARNHAKSKCTADWLLSLDADEYCHDFETVRRAANQAFMAVDCKLIAEDNAQIHMYPRLFRNSEQVWWVGAVHNHLSVIGESVDDPPVITYGYSPAHFGDKDRTLRILEREVKEHGGPRERFYLGREYWYRRRYEECVIMLGRYVQESRFLAEKAEAFMIMARCYWYGLKDPDSARDACAQCLIINPNWSEACNFMALLAGDGTDNPTWQKNADQWKRMAATASNENVLFLRNA